MTLWFDVSDLCLWDSRQLTGIQRTMVNVLTELLTLRDDVRLFRYNTRFGDLEEVHGLALPLAMRERIFGGASAPLAVKHAVAGKTSALALPTTKTAARPFRQTVARQIRRLGNDEILYALKDCWTDIHRLSTAVRHRIRKPQAPRDADGLPPPLDAHTVRKPVRPFFQEHDVCLSLSATWGFPGYPEAIARHKAKTSFTCINLIYDLIPALFPQWVSAGWSRTITLWARRQIANADLILTISDFQRKEIETFIRQSSLPLRPVRAIRLGDNAKLSNDATPPLPRMVPGRPFILCVSTLDVRKNQLCLYHVWRRMAQELGPKCPELVLVGVQHEFVSNLLHQIRHDPLVNALIHHLRDVVDAELAWYYRNCLFTVYPSVYEGWGLPIGESLAHGKYCIISDAASLPEAGGVLADYFDPLDFMECYRKIRRAVEDPAYVRQREALISSTYRPATWRETAEELGKYADAARVGAPAADRSAA